MQHAQDFGGQSHDTAFQQTPGKNCNKPSEEMMMSLLTDPRIEDHHCLLFDDDSFAPPPETIKHMKDLNTGSSHTETHKKLITTSGEQVSLLATFCINGANAGHFSNSFTTAVKFSLGIKLATKTTCGEFWDASQSIPNLHHVVKELHAILCI